MIVINGVVWKVILVIPFHPKLQRNDKIFALGSCDFFTKTIYISKDIKSSYLKKVLSHELVHAFMFSYNIDLDSEQEEVIADLIATYGEEIINITNETYK